MAKRPSTPDSLTAKQTAALNFIMEWEEREGEVPPWRQIAEKLGVKGENRSVVETLVGLGFLERQPKKLPRFTVTKRARDWYLNRAQRNLALTAG